MNDTRMSTSRSPSPLMPTALSFDSEDFMKSISPASVSHTLSPTITPPTPPISRVKPIFTLLSECTEMDTEDSDFNPFKLVGRTREIIKNTMIRLDNGEEINLLPLGEGSCSIVYELEDEAPPLIPGKTNSDLVVKVLKLKVNDDEDFKDHIQSSVDQFNLVNLLHWQEGYTPLMTALENAKNCTDCGYSCFARVTPLSRFTKLFSPGDSILNLTLQQQQDYERLLTLLLYDDLATQYGENQLDLKLDNLGRTLNTQELILLDAVNQPSYNRTGAQPHRRSFDFEQALYKKISGENPLISTSLQARINPFRNPEDLKKLENLEKLEGIEKVNNIIRVRAEAIEDFKQKQPILTSELTRRQSERQVSRTNKTNPFL